MFESYVDLLPEDKREAFKAEASKAVVLDDYLSNEDNAKGLLEKDFFKKSLQSISDKRVADYEKKFMTEKLPGLLEEERKKGQKPDWQKEIDALKADNEKQRKLNAIEKQRTRAITLATEKGIPLAVIDRYIGETEEETDAALNPVFDVLTKWKDGLITEALKKVGSQPAPQGGAASNPQDLEAQLAQAYKEGNADKALAIQSKMQSIANNKKS